MNRRDTLKSLVFLPFLITNTKETYPKIKVVDYTDSSEDYYGKVFRRVVVHPKIDESLVSKAWLCEDGSLSVATHDWIKYGRVATKETREINLPKKSWIIYQYDAQGNVLHYLTADNFV